MVHAVSDVVLGAEEPRGTMPLVDLVGEPLMTGKNPRLQMVSHRIGLRWGKVIVHRHYHGHKGREHRKRFHFAMRIVAVGCCGGEIVVVGCCGRKMIVVVDGCFGREEAEGLLGFILMQDCLLALNVSAFFSEICYKNDYLLALFVF